MLPLHDQLCSRIPSLRITPLLLAANVLVFGAMLLSGAGLWHSHNGVQLAWGANFGPATQDGQWWRLGSAMFLHFGLLHLCLNMWALWDGGQWVERMYGHFRFALIYAGAGLSGNLLSLVSHQGHAVSGGASGAIFGIYGALLSYLWLQRASIHRGEFRWLFWAAIGFSVASIGFGLMIPGIDNAAHIGGLLAGLLGGVVLIDPPADRLPPSRQIRGLAGLGFVVLLGILLANLPEPDYRWRDEKQAQQEIGEFLQKDAAITRAWESILRQGERKGASFEELADVIESVVVERYEHSFEELSALPQDANLPSALTVKRLTQYAERRRDASRAMVEGLRAKDRAKVQRAIEQARRTGKGE